MSTQTLGGNIPTFTQGDRLRKARETLGLSSTAFAARIGISQKSVNNAEADRVEVRRIVLNAWSLATGVPVEWLKTGENPRPGPDEGTTVGITGGYPQVRPVSHLRVA